jgi:hypothetical protein
MRYRKSIKELSMSNHAQTENEDERQTVYFQIANGNARQACSLKTKFPTQEQAKKYLLNNWPRIQQMARDRVENGSIEDGEIKLVMV